MVFPFYIWLVLFAALIISALGFKKYIWFISLGYGFSIAGEGLLMLILFGAGKGIAIGAALCCIIFMVYGCRLGGFLAYRELKMVSYSKNMTGEIKTDVSIGVKLAIWITCAVLYVLQVVPVFYRLHNGSRSNAWLYVGIAFMIGGIVLESSADYQKNKAKKVNPDRFVDTGLFRIVRCPNYFGEVLFWTGVILSGIGAVRGWQWLPALIGYAGIIYVMFSGARRLEMRQNKNYGQDPDYQKYVKSVPILLPFVPLYSVEKYKWLVA